MQVVATAGGAGHVAGRPVQLPVCARRQPPAVTPPSPHSPTFSPPCSTQTMRTIQAHAGARKLTEAQRTKGPGGPSTLSVTMPDFNSRAMRSRYVHRPLRSRFSWYLPSLQLCHVARKLTHLAEAHTRKCRREPPLNTTRSKLFCWLELRRLGLAVRRSQWHRPAGAAVALGARQPREIFCLMRLSTSTKAARHPGDA